jgi:hypothetical protein
MYELMTWREPGELGACDRVDDDILPRIWGLR